MKRGLREGGPAMEPSPGVVEELRVKFLAAREAAPASEVRAAAVAYYRARAAQGGTQPEVAGELGLTRWTLAKWHQKHSDVGKGGGDARAQQEASESSVAECAALKAEVEALGPRSPSRRFPEELKQRVARWARGEVERGVGTAAVANQVGIPWESISRWGGRRPRLGRAEPKLRQVRVVTGAEPERLVGARGALLKSPGGFVVEGLDVPTLVEVLRRLG